MVTTHPRTQSQQPNVGRSRCSRWEVLGFRVGERSPYSRASVALARHSLRESACL